MELVKADILVLLLILARKHLASHIKYDVISNFFETYSKAKEGHLVPGIVALHLDVLRTLLPEVISLNIVLFNNNHSTLKAKVLYN